MFKKQTNANINKWMNENAEKCSCENVKNI